MLWCERSYIRGMFDGRLSLEKRIGFRSRHKAAPKYLMGRNRVDVENIQKGSA